MPRNPNDQTFTAQPRGIKTPRMLAVEQALGKSIEEIWDEFYIKEKYGLRKMAEKFGISRGTLAGFGTRQGWIRILNLKIRNEDENILRNLEKQNKTKDVCLICGFEEGIQDAHFIPKKLGGPKCFFNIIRLCPNHHDQLDNRDNKEIEETCRKILLERAQKALKLRKAPHLWKDEE